MKVVKAILWSILTLVLLFALLLGGLTIFDYRPKEKLVIDINNNQKELLQLDKPMTITTFNIGYAGLDQGEDFFADGGTNSRGKSKEKVMENLDGIWDNIKGSDSDFLILQEVDIKSSRSYKVNQLDYFSERLPNYGYVYGKNYFVPWVPVPLSHPMGKVESGIITFSKYKAESSHRYDLPGKEKWPVQIFELDRCFTETRYPIDDGGELLLINLHLSAFDEGGLIRAKQLGYLKEYLNEEYEKGSYILVGGDWNHNLPGFDPYSFDHEEEWPFWLQNLPDDFVLDGFNWAVSTESPTVRTLAKEYTKGFNFLAIIDGFLVSDNIEVYNLMTRNDEFRYSDHNPVIMEFSLQKIR